MNSPIASNRDSRGRFLAGCAPGPGRPKGERRKVEKEYLAVTAESCSLDDWCEICRSVVQRAKDGDHNSLNFLAKIFLGPEHSRPTLSEICVEELAGHDVDRELDQDVEDWKLKDLAKRRLLVRRRLRNWDCEQEDGNYSLTPTMAELESRSRLEDADVTGEEY